MSKLYVLYEQILNYCGVKVNKDGTTQIMLGDKNKDCTINNKQLKMPYEACLKAFNSDTDIIFHPFQEHINRGESDVLKKLKQLLNIKLNLVVIDVVDQLMSILASPAIHAKLNPQQRELIKSQPAMDSATHAKAVAWMVNAYAENPTGAFVNIYLKKSGSIGGVKHSRVGVVSFPVYEQLKAKEKLSTYEKSFIQLLNFIFPGSEEGTEDFHGFSDSTIAPWIQCLLNTGYNLSSRLEEIKELYGDFCSFNKEVFFNHDWFENLQCLENYEKEILLIPSQRGNEGSVTETTSPVSTAASAATTAASAPIRTTAPVPVAAATPVQTTAPTQTAVPNPAYQFVQPLPGTPAQAVGNIPLKTADGKLNFDAVMSGQTAMAPTAMPQMMPMGMMQSAPGWGVTPITQAQMNAQMMAMQQAMMSNPALAMAMMGNPAAMQMGGMTPMGYVPPGQYTGIQKV